MYFGVNREEDREKSKQIFKEIGEEGSELVLAIFKFISGDEEDKEEKELFEKFLKFKNENEKKEKDGKEEEIRMKLVSYCERMIGEMYGFGIGVEKNFGKVMEYFEMSSKKGNPVSFVDIGFMFQFGNGVEKNLEKAFEYFQKSAEKRYSYGFFKIGYFYRKGMFVKKDIQKSIQNYEISAQMGNKIASFNLGIIYWEEEGFKDSEKSANYFFQSFLKERKKQKKN